MKTLSTALALTTASWADLAMTALFEALDTDRKHIWLSCLYFYTPFLFDCGFSGHCWSDIGCCGLRIGYVMMAR